MKIDDLPAPVVDAIAEGRAILFLGAGSSLNAKTPDGSPVPDGINLARLISGKFLKGRLTDKPLSYISELAKNEDSLFNVQAYIESIFRGVNPASFHALIPTFRWKAIITTNFDRVIEKAYEQCPERLQELIPVVRAQDWERVASTPGSIPYIKIHGCITNIRDESHPLVLASEEFAKYRKAREPLLEVLRDLIRGNHVVFCGYNLADPHIQELMVEVGNQANQRPVFVNVNPSLEEIEVRLFAFTDF